MKFSKIFDGSLFTDGESVFRKVGAANSIKVGHCGDHVFDRNDEVQPISKAQASEMSGLDIKYL